MMAKTHKNLIIKLLIGLSVFGVVILSSPLFVDAQAAQQPPTEPEIPDGFEGRIYSISVGFGGWFLWIAGGLLDYAVVKLVIGMGEYLRSGVGVAIDTLWVLIRDVFNILFIFGLIYIGFRTILFSEDSSTKKTLGLLIIAALMINFSLFITKAIVDVSNVTSFQIYNALTSDAGIAGASNTTTADDKGISSAFMDLFKMTTYAQTGVINTAAKEGGVLAGRLIFFGFMMMFVMLIAAFVFAAGAFLLISRFVALIIFMILSPAMFLGFIFPLFKKYQDMWWNKFLKYAFVGPAYLFMLYVATWVISKIAIEGSFAEAFTANSFAEGSFIIFLNFFIIAGFLIAALMVAQAMGTYGASASMGMLKRTGAAVRTRAQNTGKAVARGGFRAAAYVPKQGGRYVARATIGAASTKALKGYNNWQTENENTGKGKFMSKYGLDRALRTKLEAGKNVKAGLKYSHAENLANNEQVARRQKRMEGIDNAKDAFDSAGRVAGGPIPLTTALEDHMQTIEKQVRGMSQTEMEAGGVEFLSQDHIAIHLTSAQMDKYEKSEKINQTDFNELKSKREAALLRVASDTSASPSGVAPGLYNAKWINSQKASEVAKMPAKVLLNPEVTAGLQTATVTRIAQDRTIKTSEERLLRKALDDELSALNSPTRLRALTPDEESRRKALERWFDTPVAHSFGV